MAENLKKPDRFGILAQARKLLPRLKHDHMVEKAQYKEALAKVDTDYKAVLKEMFAFAKSAVDGNEVATVDDICDAFRDSVYGIGALMMRAENIAGPMLRAAITERAAFKEAITRGKDPLADELDDILGDDFMHYPHRCGGSANDLAYEAYDIYNSVGGADEKLLAALPVIQYMENNKMEYYFWGIFDKSCATAVIDNVPLWSKRYPLLGFVDKEPDDGVSPPDFDRFGFSSCNDYECDKRKVKVDTSFTDIFVSKLLKLYKNNEAGTAAHLEIFEMKRKTHKYAMSILAEDNIYATAKIYASFVHLLDKIDKDGMSFEAGSFTEGLPLVNAVTQYCTDFRDDRYIVNKNGLNMFIEINETLELAGMIPGFEIIAERIRKLP